MADSLSALDDGAVKYLIDNRLEPTVRNIYFAEHSASAGYISAEQQDISVLPSTGEKRDRISRTGSK